MLMLILHYSDAYIPQDFLRPAGYLLGFLGHRGVGLLGHRGVTGVWVTGV